MRGRKSSFLDNFPADLSLAFFNSTGPLAANMQLGSAPRVPPLGRPSVLRSGATAGSSSSAALPRQKPLLLDMVTSYSFCNRLDASPNSIIRAIDKSPERVGCTIAAQVFFKKALFSSLFLKTLSPRLARSRKKNATRRSSA
jgi:hypothetical protein